MANGDSVGNDRMAGGSEERPHQPATGFSFIKRKFGKRQEVQRSLQGGWFEKWKWLHYNEAEDSVLCFSAVQEFVNFVLLVGQ